MYVCVYIYIYICIYSNIFMNVCTYIYISAHISTTYTYVYNSIQRNRTNRCKSLVPYLYMLHGAGMFTNILPKHLFTQM